MNKIICIKQQFIETGSNKSYSWSIKNIPRFNESSNYPVKIQS